MKAVALESGRRIPSAHDRIRNTGGFQQLIQAVELKTFGRNFPLAGRLRTLNVSRIYRDPFPAKVGEGPDPLGLLDRLLIYWETAAMKAGIKLQANTYFHIGLFCRT